ncbi:MAG: bifunctional [glutamate--ammonia ligase]-adenylyl-L-tyrosine phosphorylase/[glutamate--ammonia-ligase] adenylyltransferase [Gammaproteobacteria bacterium]|nr:bifunctional [glutamate--ammonia ligase]-adenylyl-L-tyrosine phosphorylase/[glutamate--ammonia-ligase] adenylyltransferase [Gammaproteobacteria bacterium]
MKLEPPPDLPATLQERFHRVAERAAEAQAALPAELAAAAARVAVASDFVLSVLLREPGALLERAADDEPLTEAGVAARLDLDGLDEGAAMAKLRRLRQLETARIAWRDLTGAATLERNLADLSTLADALIRAAVAHAMAALAPRYGTPVDESGEPAPLLVLAMGKLGGRELNFSSDVDLVFLHPDEATLDGRDPEEIGGYYRKVAQRLIRLLDQPTADGFALRVDTRLRPFGASGPLVVGIAAFESYLVQHGRDWERYAYLKARLVTGRRYARAVFDQILTPYVYRRYLDYGVFDALRHMKRLIAQEVARKEMLDNVKLGPGGIREIEFIVQAFQLVRGGREARLRTPSLLEALPQLGGTRELGPAAVEELSEAYAFLRTVENRLQAMGDRQTHALPPEPEERARLAYAVGAADWDELAATLDGHRRAVEREFDRVAWDAHDTGRHDAADATTGGDAAEAWDAGDVAGALAGTALAGHAEVERLLTSLREGGLYQRMDELSRRRLAAVVVRTIPLLADKADPVATLSRLLSVFQSICRRSAYLALLHENPRALDRLLILSSQSAMLARQIAEHPLLLDELLDARIFETPPSRDELAGQLRRHLGRADPDDVEACLEAMRQFQRTAVFRVAIADRLGRLPLMKVSDRLTDIAELVLELALSMAWRELVAKHGAPHYGEPPDLREAGFAVVGYGKLGGLELGYGSDLDLVFLHDSSGSHQETDGERPLDNARFFSRLVQRLIHFLTIQTSSGRLYEVDTRLRPSGRAGLMVASVENFRRYQRGEAWVWEHQALLRSRSVAGSQSIREAFERDRKDILIHHVARERLREEIVRMRSRMRAELSQGGADGFDLKQDPGGLADIEFLVDYCVLRHAPRHPALVEYPDNIRQLEALEAASLLPAETVHGLKDAYLALRQRVHELALDERGRVVGADELEDVRAFVTSVWEDVLGSGVP